MSLPEVRYGDRAASAREWEDPDDEELDDTPADVVSMLGFDPVKNVERRTRREKKALGLGFHVIEAPLGKALSPALRAKVVSGEAHWVTVTDEKSPLHGRRLLIGGPRGSHGPVIAGHGVPKHVIDRLGVSHSADFSHSEASHDDRTGEPQERPVPRRAEISLRHQGYEGKTWLARLTGVASGGFEREFVRPSERSRSRSGATGNDTFLVPDGVYESNSGRHRQYWRVAGGQATAITREEAATAAADSAGGGRNTENPEPRPHGHAMLSVEGSVYKTGKPYVARILGRDAKYGLQREFLAGRRSGSRSGRTWEQESIITEPGLYETQSSGGRGPVRRRYYAFHAPDDGSMAVAELLPETFEQLLDHPNERPKVERRENGSWKIGKNDAGEVIFQKSLRIGLRLTPPVRGIAKAPPPSDTAGKRERSGIDVPDALPLAYDAAYRKFYKEEPDEEPRVSLRVEGAWGKVWRTSDGWGCFYFLEHPGGDIEYLGHRMADVLSYEFQGPLKKLAKHLRITPKNFREKVGWSDARWDALLRKLVNSYESPEMTISPRTPDRPMLRNPRAAGDDRGSVRKSIGFPLEKSLLDPGRVTGERDETVRLVAPTANTVWSALARIVRGFEVRGGRARIGPVTVQVTEDGATVSGPGAWKLARRIQSYIDRAVTSEDSVESRQTLSPAAAVSGQVFKGIGLPS